MKNPLPASTLPACGTAERLTARGRNAHAKRRKVFAATPLACLGLVMVSPTIAQQPRHASAYDAVQVETVLTRSVFYLPLFGAVYQAKFAALVGLEPRLRGVVIHNHGCGGMWGWETSVAQFYYREGFAVITPEFVTREGNKTGCPGSTAEEMLARASERAREGVFTAVNPVRLDARGDDIEAVVRWISGLTDRPIFLSGHSEGCRTVYHWRRSELPIRGGICHKQSLTKAYEHLWNWDVRLPMWSSIEDEDPWAGGSTARPAPGFQEKFKDAPENLTEFRFSGNSHDPLVRPGEAQSLRQWLDRRVERPAFRTQAGFNYEDVLPAVQAAVKAARP